MKSKIPEWTRKPYLASCGERGRLVLAARFRALTWRPPAPARGAEEERDCIRPGTRVIVAGDEGDVGEGSRYALVNRRGSPLSRQ